MLIRSMLWLTAAVQLGGAALPGHASDQPLPAADLPVSQAAEAAHQVVTDQVRQEWRLDPAIFTDILPVTAPDVAIKLPEDQREER